MEEINAIERIRYFIRNQSLSERKFFIESGLSEGSFNKIKSIGSENLKKISHRFPDLNMDWVITGRGEMLLAEVGKTVMNITEDEKIPYGDTLQRLIKEHEELKDKYIGCLEENKWYRDTYEKINLNEPAGKEPAK